MKKKLLYSGHYLMGSRFDNWIRLLAKNKFKVRLKRVPEALYISLVSLLFFVPAIIERMVYLSLIKKHCLKEDPIYIMGFWRSGTTFLQNLMCSDRQFGFCNPVSTTTFNNSLLLGWLIAPQQKKILKDARPMDNLEYKINSPMEEIFAMTGIFPYCIDNMLTFPECGFDYIEYGFLAEQDEKIKNEWRRKYRYMLNKMTYINKDKRLILKSPDNTCNISIISEEFPNAQYVNIYRNPYTVIMSTINMFDKQIDFMTLQKPMTREELENGIVDTFARTYRNFFRWIENKPPEKVIEIKYENFEKTPVQHMEKIYKALGLKDFLRAKPAFENYVAAQSGYKKNKFNLDERLKEKINSKLEFYFEHYGYEML